MLQENANDLQPCMSTWIHITLPAQYNLRVGAVREIDGGWAASAFAVQTDAGRYFAKVYDKHRPSVRPWVDRMPLYMPIVLWLSGNTPLKDRMVAPILTTDGGYKAESERFVLLLFPFVAGKTLAGRRLTPPQIHQLAETLALLHSFGADIPVPTQSIEETYALPFLDGLVAAIHRADLPPDLCGVLAAHTGVLEAAEDLRLLADQLRADPPRNVLCHTDLHGWNLMWDRRLILIDWEGLRLAPVESDLVTFSEGFFFDRAREAFFAAYQKVCPAYAQDETALRFYRLRRRLEDIAEYVDSILHDRLSPAQAAASLRSLQRECALLGRAKA